MSTLPSNKPVYVSIELSEDQCKTVYFSLSILYRAIVNDIKVTHDHEFQMLLSVGLQEILAIQNILNEVRQ